MKNGPLFFLGLFVALTLSWAGVVLGSHLQLGTLAPYVDENEGKAFPERPSGLAARGQLVYADLDCASCHTQQVRRADFGEDVARGWGERQSYARDYIYQAHVELGESRVGPDLANVGNRKPPYDAEDLLKLLYTGTLPLTKVVTHPPYKFLFDERTIVGQRSAAALKFPGSGMSAGDSEIVPTERARTLVAYLLSLNQGYNYPVEAAANTVKPAAKEGETSIPNPHGAPEKAPAPAAPAKEGAHK
jgi:cytochrome c oxidase cbb3-type subunit 2